MPPKTRSQSAKRSRSVKRSTSVKRSSSLKPRSKPVIKLVTPLKKLRYSLGHGFQLAKSQIPHAGKGVWTTRAYKEGTLLSQYGGRWLTEKEADACFKCTYLLDVAKNAVIDGEYVEAVDGAPIGSFINDPRNSKLVNVRFEADGKHVLVFADRDIRKGEELFWGYGTNFWRRWQSMTKLKPSKLTKLA